MSTRIQNNLRHLRESRNRTKSWVAEQLGKKDATIGDYERGRATPPLKVLEQFADLFEIYIGDLVGRDLWLGEGSAVSDNDAPDDYLVREKRALHLLLDGKEANAAKLREELEGLRKDLAGAPKDSPLFGRIQRMIDLLKP